MRIIINAVNQEVESGLSLLALLGRIGKSPGQCVVERNGEIVDLEGFETVVLREHDRLEIVHFVGGG